MQPSTRIAHDDWLAANPKRHAPELVYGATWTAEAAPRDPWQIIWNSGTNQLYALNGTDGTVEVLGAYQSKTDVDRALGGWEQRAQSGGGLDWIRRRAIDTSPTGAADHQLDAVAEQISTGIHGIVIAGDGTRRTLHQPVSLPQITAATNAALDITRVEHEPPEELGLVVITVRGGDNPSPAAAGGIELRHLGSLTAGDTIVLDEGQRPLSPTVIAELLPEHNTIPEVIALEWDDRLDDLERNYDADYDVALDRDFDL